MYKHTTIFYPHIVKQYETMDQFVTENGYDDYYAAKHQELEELGFDINDSTKVFEGLSEDGFEAITTIIFESEADWNAKQPITQNRETEYSGMKKPIFEEEFVGDSDQHVI